MIIEESEASFSINVVGNKTNNTYLGNFKVKCLLSPLDEIKADRLYREMIGPNSHLAKEHVSQLLYALSQLKFRVTLAPPFWKEEELSGGHIEDDNVIYEVLNLAIEAQIKYVEKKKKELKEKQERLTRMIKNKIIKPEKEVEEEDVLQEAGLGED